MGLFDRFRRQQTPNPHAPVRQLPAVTAQAPSTPRSGRSAASVAEALDGYFDQLTRLQDALGAGDYDTVRSVAVAVVRDLPNTVDAFWADTSWHRTNDGRTVAVPPSIPALDLLSHLAAVDEDHDLLELLADAVASRPDLAHHQDLLDRARRHLPLTGQVVDVVADERGVLQSTLGKRLGVSGRDTRTVVEWLEKRGRVVRNRDSKQWRLYQPDVDPGRTDDDLEQFQGPPAGTQVPTRSGCQPRPIPTPFPPRRTAIDGCQSGTFAAIDFETATSARASACAVAVTVIDDGQLTDSRSWLIRPPGNEYDSFNTFLHGIGPEHTAGAPDFLAVMAAVLAAIGDRPVLAHYASFDIGVLRQSYMEAGAPWPSLQLGCTVILARRTWPGLASYSLPVVAAFLNLDRFVHHDAAADSRVCADVARAVLAHTGGSSLEESAESVGVHFGRLDPASYAPCRSMYLSAGNVLDRPDPDELNPEHPLFGAHVSFTGALWSMTRKEAAQRVVDAGGEFHQNPGRKTDYLVFGQQDFTRFLDGESSAKTKRALAVIDDGYPLQVVEEAEFLRML